MSHALHASPPRIGELDTRKFVFSNLHKNATTVKQKKNRKLFILVRCEDLKFWTKNGPPILTSQKTSPMSHALHDTPPKQRVPSLKKGYGCARKPFATTLKQKKNESDHFFSSNFQSHWQHELSLWESGSLRQWLWEFAGFSSPFESTKLSTQNHPESSL